MLPINFGFRLHPVFTKPTERLIASRWMPVEIKLEDSMMRGMSVDPPVRIVLESESADLAVRSPDGGEQDKDARARTELQSWTARTSHHV